MNVRIQHYFESEESEADLLSKILGSKNLGLMAST